jgi:type VI secretion system protein ImpC
VPDPGLGSRQSTGHDRRAWAALRRLPEAAFIGLALPGFLLRLPYGAATEVIDTFAFEEMADLPVHAAYLWGNSAFACVCLLGQAFSRRGWRLRAGEVLDLEGLPLHGYKELGKTRNTPCAEVLMTVHEAEHLLEQGLMPLLSFKDQDRIRLAQWQAIADPLTSLAGPWNR